MMEADKSWDLQLANWRASGAVQVQKPEEQEGQWRFSSLKVSQVWDSGRADVSVWVQKVGEK